MALAALAFAVSAPGAYVAQRLYEVWWVGAPSSNPALVIRAAHTAFYWRAATATWWGGLIAAIAYGAVRYAGRSGRRAAWLVTRGAIAWIVLLVVLAWAVP